MELPKLATRREVELGYTKTDFRIRQITDTHIKGNGFHDSLFKGFVQIQKRDKNSAWIHTGDVGDPDRTSRREIDAIANANRKSEIITQNEKNKLWVENYIIPKFAPIADSCLGFIAGDHYMVIDGEPCTKYIAKRLGVPYLGERSAFVQVLFKWPNRSVLTYTIHARHGKGTARTDGGDVSSLVRQEIGQFADLHLGGHTHKQNCHPVRVEYVNSHGIIKDKICWYMRGGSFLDRPEYAQKAEYSPLPCGWGEVELNLGFLKRGEGKCNVAAVTMSKCSIVVG